MSQPAEPTAPPVTVYGDGTPVVLLHAFPLDSRMWVPQVEALGGYQAIVPDLRGFGAARERAGEITPMDLLAEGVGFLPEAMVQRLLGKTTRQQRPELVEQVTETIGDQDPRGIAAALRGMAERPDSTGVLGQVSVPTLVISGMEDELIPPDEAVRMAATIRDARLIQVPDAGHLVNLEQADTVNEALLDFLAPLWI